MSLRDRVLGGFNFSRANDCSVFKTIFVVKLCRIKFTPDAVAKLFSQSRKLNSEKKCSLFQVFNCADKD